MRFGTSVCLKTHVFKSEIGGSPSFLREQFDAQKSYNFFHFHVNYMKEIISPEDNIL